MAAMFVACVAGCLDRRPGLRRPCAGSRMSDYWPQFLGTVKFAAFLTIAAGLTIGIYGTLRERLEETTLQLRTKELERERALKLATEAQLASLESRIHPHFLFNTLNSISSLIPEDPARAERLVEQMAALLRFSLDANQSGLVPLSSELKIVADYLEIERARFGDRLRYQIDVPAELNELPHPARCRSRRWWRTASSTPSRPIARAARFASRALDRTALSAWKSPTPARHSSWNRRPPATGSTISKVGCRRCSEIGRHSFCSAWAAAIT